MEKFKQFLAEMGRATAEEEEILNRTWQAFQDVVGGGATGVTGYGGSSFTGEAKRMRDMIKSINDNLKSFGKRSARNVRLVKDRLQRTAVDMPSSWQQQQLPQIIQDLDTLGNSWSQSPV